ncbi:hypothetical protein V1507DRAFT_449960 [Lipomyces tetrasporus]
MSTTLTSARIPIEEFRTKLESKKQSMRAVQAIKASKFLIFRFEDDATGADQDANTFSGCMQDVFGIDDVEDFVIGKTSKFPGADVERLLLARSLLIIAYMGHGIIDIESNRLQLISENGSQKMLWSDIHEYILAPTYDLIQNLDVLAVFDCYYAGSAVRAGANRLVQLLARCDERHTVRSRQDGVTFTQRFRRAAWALKRAGDLSVSVESLFGE